MNDLFQMLLLVLGLCVSGLIGYLISYSKQKGKNRALLEDVKRLENEKQEVIQKYQSELEMEKKQHQLDIEKRKYRYEEKSKQFSSFFSRLDEYNSRANNAISTRFNPIIQKFFADFMKSESTGDNALASGAIATFAGEVQNLTTEFNDELLRIKHETNAIRLIASKAICGLIEDLDCLLKSAFDKSIELIRELSKPEVFRNAILVKPIEIEIEKITMQIKAKREEIMDEMKNELDQI